MNKYIDLKGATKKDRKLVCDIIRAEFEELFLFIENETDYFEHKNPFEAVSCFVNFTPISLPCISAIEFLKKHHEKQRNQES